MLKLNRRSALVASSAVFAALYAVLGTIPISKILLGQGYFLSASKFVSPLAGMLFGPFVGGFGALLGDLLDVYAGYISVGGTGLAITASDLATVATAGFAYTGKWKAALALPLIILISYWLDPISLLFVGTVPFTWLHMISLILLGGVLLLEKTKKISKLNPIFVVGVTFGALLCGQLTGTIVGQELSVRIYQTTSLQSWRGFVPSFFFVYPIERTFFTAVGSLISVPVLRALWRRQHPHTLGNP
ncbi:MAG TPA: hypothetical protein VGR53_05600 [Nitrososphaerales archaeon]|nr:hypothetical protein [Nitrososphaerales archaeon]